jgi:hypothetical protein
MVLLNFWQLCQPQMLAFATILIYYSSHEFLRREIWEEVIEILPPSLSARDRF